MQLGRLAASNTELQKVNFSVTTGETQFFFFFFVNLLVLQFSLQRTKPGTWICLATKLISVAPLHLIAGEFQSKTKQVKKKKQQIYEHCNSLKDNLWTVKGLNMLNKLL